MWKWVGIWGFVWYDYLAVNPERVSFGSIAETILEFRILNYFSK